MVAGVIGSGAGRALRMYQAGRFDDVSAAQLLGIAAMAFALSLVLVSITSVAAAGVVHGLLLLLGAGRRGFEATWRTLAYAQGSGAMFGIIPGIGSTIGVVWILAVAVPGLAEMQETDTLYGRRRGAHAGGALLRCADRGLSDHGVIANRAKGSRDFPRLHGYPRVGPLRSPATCAITARAGALPRIRSEPRGRPLKPAAQEAAMTDFGTPGSFPSAPMPPSSGARTGPPWEQPGAFFQRWLDTAKSILLDPQGGFRNVRRTGGLGAPFTYYAVGARPAILVCAVPADRHRRHR